MDEQIGYRLRLLIIQEAIRSGELSLQEKSDEEKRQAIKEFLEKYTRDLEELEPHEEAGDVEVRIVINYDHTSLLVAQARDFASKEKLDFAFMFYATWAEHWANQVISTMLTRYGFDEDAVSEVIRETSFRGKFTWLIPLLDIPEIPDIYVKTLQHLSEIRNSYVHYKWKFQTVETIEGKEREARKLVDDVEQVVEYLQGYLADNHISLPDDELLEFMPTELDI